MHARAFCEDPPYEKAFPCEELLPLRPRRIDLSMANFFAKSLLIDMFTLLFDVRPIGLVVFTPYVAANQCCYKDEQCDNFPIHKAFPRYRSVSIIQYYAHIVNVCYIFIALPLMNRYIAQTKNTTAKPVTTATEYQILMSEVPKNPYLNPLTMYSTGLKYEMFCHTSGNR